MSIFENILKYYDFCSGLDDFLKNELSLEECREIVIERLKRRDDLFLEFVRERVFSNDGSPYLKLMETAGIKFEDIESMVKKKGLEGTLRELAERGVYVTIDEFKGREVCKRNGHEFRFREEDFDNRNTKTAFTATSGGTRSAGTPIMMNFGYVKDCSIFHNILIDAFDLSYYPCVVWFPGALGALIVIDIVKIGKIPERWFSQVPWVFQMRNKRFSSLKDALMINSMRVIGKKHGINLPKPEFIDFDNTIRVVEAISEIIEKNKGCFVTTLTSSALRACKIAKENGIEIEGTYFLVSGEPVTDSKKKEIESSGAKVIPYYGSMEAGVIGSGCVNSKETDDCHIMDHYIALIQYKKKVKKFGVEVDAFLITSFLPHAPKTLLNVEMGDFGVIEERSCGCKWEKLGLKKHIHTIRSFEKLTGEGMTILNTDLIRIVEEVLPGRFGGSITDYQIVEREDKEGFTKLEILISPDLGDLDEEKVIDVILTELKIKGKDSGSAALSAEMWEKAKTIKIKREYPKKTKVGKIFSFQVESTN